MAVPFHPRECGAPARAIEESTPDERLREHGASSRAVTAPAEALRQIATCAVAWSSDAVDAAVRVALKDHPRVVALLHTRR
jgi:hypothetical protein